MDAKALKHDKTVIKSLMGELCSLAQDRLLDTIYNREKEIRALDPGRARPPFRPRAGKHGRASQANT